MAAVAAHIDVTSRGNDLYTADVTDLVRGWVSRTVPNEGLFLETHDTLQYAIFRSSEDLDPTLRPRLRLVYRR
jgi:hypothetical protein